MTSPSKNDITGDRLITKPTNDAYRDNWDRIFGKPKEKDKKCCGGNTLCTALCMKEHKNANSTD